MSERRLVGLVGVGLLGTALAERLLAAGCRVRGFDLNPARLGELQQLGGEPAEDLVELLWDCPYSVLCLPDDLAVDRVVDLLVDRLAERPAARRGVHSGPAITGDPCAPAQGLGVERRWLLDTTTGHPGLRQPRRARLSPYGFDYLEACVVGSSQQVRDGRAMVLVGGEASELERGAWLPHALSPTCRHVGGCGQAATMKLVINLVLGLQRAVLAEGLGFARANGIPPAQALEVLRSSAAYCVAMDTKGAKMVAGDYTPQARLAQHAKDVDLILDLARSVQAQAPLSQTHRQLLQEALDQGWGELDNSAIHRCWTG